MQLALADNIRRASIVKWALPVSGQIQSKSMVRYPADVNSQKLLER